MAARGSTPSLPPAGSPAVNTVAKLMRAGGIRARASRRTVRTTDSRHGLPVAPNALGRDFAPAGPNQKWCADFTYVPTLEGWLFLAVVVTCSAGGSWGGPCRRR